MTPTDPPASMRAGAVREIVTPEGLALRVRLAARGDRFFAVLIDIGIILLGLASIVLIAIAIFPDTGGKWAMSLAIVLSFGIRGFYFIFFELRWQGTTPGKRLLGLRVIDRNGGRLLPGAIFARNLMREVELFMPVTLLMSVHGGNGFWVNLLTLSWTGMLMALPWFNRDRLRCGDIVAGTWVVETPKTALLPDIAVSETDKSHRTAIRFTPSQLSVYGVYELQTLEKVLRQDAPDTVESRAAIARTIQAKIGWTPSDEHPVDASDFLRAFYAALRGHLEHSALFGKPRANKFDRP
ncbi:MAG: RDD family protein [Alphaproteobacteria bacterium]